MGHQLAAGRPEAAAPIGAEAFLATLEQYEGCSAEVLDAEREACSRASTDDAG